MTRQDCRTKDTLLHSCKAASHLVPSQRRRTSPCQLTRDTPGTTPSGDMGQPWCKQPQAHHPRQLQRSATSQARVSTFIEATTIAQLVMPRLPLDGGSRVNIDLHNYTKERSTEASQSSPTTTHKFLITHRGHQGSSSRHSHDYLWKRGLGIHINLYDYTKGQSIEAT